MLKNSLKQNDTFLVTVEIITSDAIIVSATINSVIYRGTLIRCNKNSSLLFNKINDSQTSFSTSRLDLKNLKRHIRFKTFKSNYNLRRTNNKIKAKSITKNEVNKKSLSIKLKKDNGVYVNTSNLSSWTNDTLNIKKTDLTEKNELSVKNRTNIIKIVKTKSHSDQYEYAICNSHEDNSSQSKILKLCLTPIPDILLSQTDLSKSNNSKFDFGELAIKTESINNVNQLTLHTSNLSSEPKMNVSEPIKTTEIKLEPSLSIINHPNETIFQSKDPPQSIISDSTEKSKSDVFKSCKITKLKIIKNGSKPNSYVIKSPEKVTDVVNSKFINKINTNVPNCKNIKTRYNCKKFCIGDIVWAKLSGYSIWPAKVIDLNSVNDNATVMWLGDDYRTSELVRYKLWDFRAHFNEKFNKKAKGNYMTAVQQAQIEYAKLDNNENSAWIFDISSESSTLESVNIDDTSCELDQISLQESLSIRQNIYLPLAEEEFELMQSSSKSAMSDFLSFDSPGSQERDNHTHSSPAKYFLNAKDADYNFI